jgi:anaerobic selenocysteine-containing dehydrogenase
MTCDPEEADAETLDRRAFLRLLSATVAVASAEACTRAPAKRVVPYGNPPPEVTPGVPSHYATARVLDGYATGLVVTSREGRPTKVEGNPLHPASLGATSALDQASVLDLYDPSRARAPRLRGEARTWDAFFEAFSHVGDGLHIVMEPTSSP